MGICMIGFKEYVDLHEARNRGVLYHFTTIDLCMMMLDPIQQKQLDNTPLKLLTSRHGVSFTRNSSLPTHPTGTMSGLNVRNGYVVRIAVNGDRLSDVYSIRPIAGLSDDSDHSGDITDKNKPRMSRSSGEAEELAIPKNSSVDIKKFVIRIDLIGGSTKDFEEIKNLADNLNINVFMSNIFPTVKL